MPLNEDAANFLKYAFTETKDLAKHFLTVMTAVLVFSLTFAEKIAGFSNADRLIRSTLGAAWCSFLLAIISCGIATCYVALSGGAAAANGTPDQFWLPMSAAIKWLIGGGVMFVLGLVALIFAAIRSAVR